jgi:hypothetical protein
MDRFTSSNESKYQANGFIKGLYIPSKNVIKADDGEFALSLSPSMRAWLRKHPEILKQEQVFHVYPRCHAESLSFYAIAIMPDPSPRLIDWFCIRGELNFWNDKNKILVMQIRRSIQKDSFKINIKGQLPCKKRKGEFWEMRCVREGHSFVLSEPVKLVVPHKELHVA